MPKIDPITRMKRFQTLAEIEKKIIIQRLKDLEWRKSLVAQSLGISPPTLDNRIKAYGVQIPQSIPRGRRKSGHTELSRRKHPFRPRPHLLFQWVSENMEHEQRVPIEQIYLLGHSFHDRLSALRRVPLNDIPIEGFVRLKDVGDLVCHGWLGEEKQ